MGSWKKRSEASSCATPASDASSPAAAEPGGKRGCVPEASDIASRRLAREAGREPATEPGRDEMGPRDLGRLFGLSGSTSGASGSSLRHHTP